MYKKAKERRIKADAEEAEKLAKRFPSKKGKKKSGTVKKSETAAVSATMIKAQAGAGSILNKTISSPSHIVGSGAGTPENQVQDVRADDAQELVEKLQEALEEQEREESPMDMIQPVPEEEMEGEGLQMDDER